MLFWRWEFLLVCDTRLCWGELGVVHMYVCVFDNSYRCWVRIDVIGIDLIGDLWG